MGRVEICREIKEGVYQYAPTPYPAADVGAGRRPVTIILDRALPCPYAENVSQMFLPESLFPLTR